jgi:hypothetical protein
MPRYDIIAEFDYLLPRYARIDRDPHGGISDENWGEYIDRFFPPPRNPCHWFHDRDSYTNLIELALQSLVYKFIQTAPNDFKEHFNMHSAETICVRFVQSHRLILESVSRGDYQYIILSRPAFSLPFYSGVCLSLLATQNISPRVRSVRSNIIGGPMQQHS